MGNIEKTEFQLPDDKSGSLKRGGPTPTMGKNDEFASGLRPVDPTEQSDDADAELSLRPRSLDEFIGQSKVREQLELVLSGAKARRVVPDHILLAGPPGLGKTTMAMIIAQEMGRHCG